MQSVELNCDNRALPAAAAADDDDDDDDGDGDGMASQHSKHVRYLVGPFFILCRPDHMTQWELIHISGRWRCGRRVLRTSKLGDRTERIRHAVVILLCYWMTE